MMKTEKLELRIYVANLHAYNCGHLVGEWITLPMDKDEMWDFINTKVLDKFPGSEEIAIHDFEDYGIKVDENDNIEELNEFMQAIQDSHLPLEVIGTVISNYSQGYLIDHISEIYCYNYSTMLEFVESDDFEAYLPYGIQELIRTYPSCASYVDYEAIARDEECGCAWIQSDNYIINCGF